MIKKPTQKTAKKTPVRDVMIKRQLEIRSVVKALRKCRKILRAELTVDVLMPTSGLENNVRKALIFTINTLNKMMTTLSKALLCSSISDSMILSSFYYIKNLTMDIKPTNLDLCFMGPAGIVTSSSASVGSSTIGIENRRCNTCSEDPSNEKNRRKKNKINAKMKKVTFYTEYTKLAKFLLGAIKEIAKIYT